MFIIRIAVIAGLAGAMTTPAAAQPVVPDAAAIVEFQRALDAYAFQHRQAERRAGESADERAMASAMRAVRPAPRDGDIFTPLVGAAFQARIIRAQRAGCAPPRAGESFEVPRPNQSAAGAAAIPDCLAAALPRLPAELAYRASGVVLLLVDTHANLVIDVLHGAFPRP